MYAVDASKLTKRFGPRLVFKDIAFSLKTGGSLAVIGRNGSGKTTLLRILAGLTAPSRGRLDFSTNGDKLDRTSIRCNLSYIGPEMTLYDALTARENLRFFATMRGISMTDDEIEAILTEFQLAGRGKDFYGAYSSGMKQRLKYAVALLNDPAFLLLDEPSANLDEEGKELVSKIISRQKENGVLIIATNEKEEYDLAETRLEVGV
ncbi:MAG: ABC transporter ATP-binding protein [FCB group bacterium]|nr:ABC transporter ATP-binding protein [FCB group bacterium]